MLIDEDRDYQKPTVIQAEKFRPSGPEARMHYSDPSADGIDAVDPLDSPEANQLHKRLLAYYVNELDIQEASRAEMREDERFYDGDQWDSADAAVLGSRGQMPLVFNVIAPAINWLTGTERQNRTQYKILPREKTDGPAARLKTELMKYVDDANNAEYDRSTAFADAVKVGIGWLEEGWQGDSGEEPVFVRSESWRNILWDSRARRLDLSDSRFIFRPKWVDLDVAMRLCPGPRNEALLRQSASAAGDIIGSLITTGDEAMDEAETDAMIQHTSTIAGIGADRNGPTFHDLRGTAVTRLALSGCSEAEIATITGHSLNDVGAILDAHYLKRDGRLAESAIRKLEAHENGTKIPK